jgi:hypothetical protein
MTQDEPMKNIWLILAVAIIAGSSGCTTPPPYTAESVIKAQQAQPPATPRPPAAPATNQIVAVSPATPALTYPIDRQEHWVNGVVNRGEQIKLEDGSVWEIAPKDRVVTMAWQITRKVVVTNGTYPGYPYRLTTLVKLTTVDAKLVSLSR